MPIWHSYRATCLCWRPALYLEHYHISLSSLLYFSSLSVGRLGSRQPILRIYSMAATLPVFLLYLPATSSLQHTCCLGLHSLYVYRAAYLLYFSTSCTCLILLPSPHLTTTSTLHYLHTENIQCIWTSLHATPTRAFLPHMGLLSSVQNVLPHATWSMVFHLPSMPLPACCLHSSCSTILPSASPPTAFP